MWSRCESRSFADSSVGMPERTDSGVACASVCAYDCGCELVDVYAQRSRIARGKK